MSDLNSIPDIRPDLEALASAARVMKEMLESISAQRRGQGVGSPRMFYQPLPPDPRLGDQLKLCDLWIDNRSKKLSFWDGRFWVPVTSA